jgi:hypothetical protein
MPANYLNERVITDDAFSARTMFMVRGQASPQDVKPHWDLLTEFPFLRTPYTEG